MSETTIYALAITVGLIAQIILQVMAKIDAMKLANQQKAIAIDAAAKLRMAAFKVDEVKTTLAEQTAATSHKLDDIHTLVNSNMGTQLKLNSVLARRLADLPGATEADRTAATDAERMYNDHVAKQAVVDGGK